MDPITLAITTALGKLGETIIADAYAALKAALQKKYGIDGNLSQAVEKLEQKPDSNARKEVLKEEVKAVKADRDPELLKTAQALIAKLKELPDGQTIINQTITGNKNIFSGTGDVTVTNPPQD
jgi:hypothetical protein